MVHILPPSPAGDARGDWPVRAEMLLPSMPLSDIRLSLGEPSRLQGLQPVDMLVMSSSVSGTSYRSVVTFSGQGRLNDILTWNKAKGRVNSKYKKNQTNTQTQKKVCYSGPAQADVQISSIRRLHTSRKHSCLIPGKKAVESADDGKNNNLMTVSKASPGWLYQDSRAHLSTGDEVFSMKLIIFSLTFTDLDLRANVILFTKDLTPFPSPELLSDSPCIQKCKHAFQKATVALSLETLVPPTSAELRLLWDPEVLTIQWMYEESRPSTFMSTRCCWRAKNTASPV